MRTWPMYGPRIHTSGGHTFNGHAVRLSHPHIFNLPCCLQDELITLLDNWVGFQQEFDALQSWLTETERMVRVAAEPAASLQDKEVSYHC